MNIGDMHKKLVKIRRVVRRCDCRLTHTDIMFMTILCWPIRETTKAFYTCSRGDFGSLSMWPKWISDKITIGSLFWLPSHWRRPCGLPHTSWLRANDTDVVSQHRDPLSLEKGRRPCFFVNVIRHSITSVAANQSVLWHCLCPCISSCLLCLWLSVPFCVHDVCNDVVRMSDSMPVQKSDLVLFQTPNSQTGCIRPNHFTDWWLFLLCSATSLD